MARKIYPCSYCGSIHANTLDHVIPHSYDHVHNKRTYSKDKVVPCCSECNTMLGNKLFDTISEKAAYLILKYNKKYKKLLSLPNWDEEELEEIDGRLKEKIVSSNRRKNNIKLKIDNCGLVRDVNPSINDIWEHL